jgi:DNA mismatch repair protein MutS
VAHSDSQKGTQIKKKSKLTPLMEQYNNIKKDHQDKLLLFRMGDFYELFGEDARLASEVLNITLTKRNQKSGDDTLMCGFPHHSMEAPINKLLDAGHCVAVCNQLEDPSQAKGIVKRGVTLLLSPGVVFNTGLLSTDESHYILSFDSEKVSWIEPSTGKAFYQKVKNQTEVNNIIYRIKPKEILCLNKSYLDSCQKFKTLKKNVESDFKKGLLNIKDSKKTLLDYLDYMQGEGASFGFVKWVEVKSQETMRLNPHFFKHIEVFQSNEGDRSKSLFSALKKTKTPGGTRLLRDFLENPLVNLKKISERQRAIYKWKEDYSRLIDFREKLSFVGDFERRLARAGHPLGSPQDLLRLKKSIAAFLDSFSEIYFEDRKQVVEIHELLEKSIEEDPVGQWSTKGGYIKKGFRKDLDHLIDLASGAQLEINSLEEAERKKTGISTLKVRYNNVFGFYIEVTKTHKDKVPDHYVRKQTLTNAERYTTQELSSLEEKVLSAKAKKVTLEKEVFEELKNQIRSNLKPLKKASEICNYEDVFSSQAYLCFEKSFSIPNFSEDRAFEVRESFHPVVADELASSGQQSFVTNEINLNESSNFFLITGPNMAGKSTMMRQIVVIAYLSQCGLVVPAHSAQVPVYDSIFTRVGASDVLSEGLSTFMVEMTETAEILNQATSQSLLILDEIGRGTSSSDGSALARSIALYIMEKIGCHTLFATHYHELTDAFSQIKGFQNIHMGYSEKDGKIVFTYKIKDGASKKSYGIEVAKLAGLPNDVVEAAKSMASQSVQISSNMKSTEDGQGNDSKQELQTSSLQLELPLNQEFDEKARFLLDELCKIRAAEMTPLEALTKISQWQDNYL